MTPDDMNGRFAKKMTGAFVTGASVVLLSACAGAFEAEKGDSALDQRVQALVEANRRYPEWSDFPKASQDVPTPEQIAAAVNALSGANIALTGEVDRLVWTSDDPARFESQVRQRLAAIPPSPEAARTLEQLEAWAEDLRRRGEAPPPIGRPQ